MTCQAGQRCWVDVYIYLGNQHSSSVMTLNFNFVKKEFEDSAVCKMLLCDEYSSVWSAQHKGIGPLQLTSIPGQHSQT
jgi:hypothetical protein